MNYCLPPDKNIFKTGVLMQTHDEDTKKFFKHSSVICVLAPRYASSEISWVKQQLFLEVLISVMDAMIPLSIDYLDILTPSFLMIFTILHFLTYKTNGDSQPLWKNKEFVFQKINNGSILDAYSLCTLEGRKDFLYTFSLLVHNTKPIGDQDLVSLVISMMILADLGLVLLTLLQLYFSLGYVFIVVFILPLGILSPFPAGINAPFIHGSRRSIGTDIEDFKWSWRVVQVLERADEN